MKLFNVISLSLITWLLPLLTGLDMTRLDRAG